MDGNDGKCIQHLLQTLKESDCLETKDVDGRIIFVQIK
jgi:hypothetical protein